MKQVCTNMESKHITYQDAETGPQNPGDEEAWRAVRCWPGKVALEEVPITADSTTRRLRELDCGIFDGVYGVGIFHPRGRDLTDLFRQGAVGDV